MLWFRIILDSKIGKQKTCCKGRCTGVMIGLSGVENGKENNLKYCNKTMRTINSNSIAPSAEYAFH